MDALRGRGAIRGREGVSSSPVLTLRSIRGDARPGTRFSLFPSPSSVVVVVVVDTRARFGVGSGVRRACSGVACDRFPRTELRVVRVERAGESIVVVGGEWVRRDVGILKLSSEPISHQTRRVTHT